VGNPEKFEEALAELEGIVRKMEDGDLSLDESLDAFERGVGLVRFCRKKLDDAQRKVELLLQDEKGNLHVEPFEIPDSERDGEAR